MATIEGNIKKNLQEIIDMLGDDNSTLNLSEPGYNKIYFGAPGSGKSFYVNKLIKGHKDHSYRTTFHPDTDYASFVGSYKPVVRAKMKIRTDYSMSELASILKEEYERATNKVAALHGFILKYVDYFNGKIKKFSKKEFVKEAGIPEDYHAEVNKMVNLYDWMVSNDIMAQSTSISYEYVPQVFVDAYVDAWKNTDEQVYLIIEEINRGNCAQIFGDLFQLLDRNESGASMYTIKADRDLRNYLLSVLGEDNEGILKGELRIPRNMSILATMNTSDQSLFPMDSAFKRRWAWEYVPIDADCKESQFKISIGDNVYLWASFLTKVNERIHRLSDSEDKQLGNFFIKEDIGVDDFKSKVMFYLWSEVCKDYENAGSFFKYVGDGGIEVEFSFNSLYPTGDKTNKILQGFMDYLNVEKDIDATNAANKVTAFVDKLVELGLEKIADLKIMLNEYPLVGTSKPQGYGFQRKGGYYIQTAIDDKDGMIADITAKLA